MIDINETITSLTNLKSESFIVSFLEGSLLILSVIMIYIFFHRFVFNFVKDKAMKSNIIFLKKMICNGAIKKILWIATLNLLYLFSDSFQNETFNQIYNKALFLAIVVFAIRLAFNIIDMIIDRFEREVNDGKTDQYFPIKPVFQIIKLLIFIISVILLIAHFVDQSPVYILSGLTAISAVFMFIFKDVIQGFIAAFQVSLHKTVKIGDWIEVPKYLVNGEVNEITLNLISVRNFDNTMTVIPTHSLLTESFKNWTTMFKDGRRIKRCIHIDSSSVKQLSVDDIERLKKIKLIKNYLVSKQVELEDSNSDVENDEFFLVNGRSLTNIGTFRKYIEFYLKSNREIKQDLMLVVRLMDDSARGIPIEIYCFSNKTSLYQFEGVQSDIFEHIIAVMPLFGLRLFQEVSSVDVGCLIKSIQR